MVYRLKSLLQSIFIIAQKTGKPVYEAIQLFTCNPAKAIHLFCDRGSLEVVQMSMGDTDTKTGFQVL
ncbi:hypothetical protein [Nostoc sp.]|uniref:hypothetical protein n=1 Tax=Nostoc sp. TaxID=1180 RepID=UPI002FFB6C0E